MSDETPAGPDLTRGVPVEAIGDGAMLSGHVGDEAVLIARVDGQLHAIGAACTHYHGPLAEGLIVGSAVRCPWHHACFDLKTGEALGAPAIDPVACWAVETRDGKVFVTSRKPSTTAKTRTGAARRVVIIGGGAAGFATAEWLRREGFEGDVTLLSADDRPPYDRPNCSKDFLAGEAPAEWMPLRGDDFYKDQRIKLRLGVEATGFDPRLKTVSLKDEDALPYDVLVLAMGAEPQRPPIPGFDNSDVHVLRTLGDAEAIIAAAEKATRVAVIGASFIGLEAAAALTQRKLEVHVIAPEATPLEKVLGHDLGEWVRRLHEEKGVTFHLGRKVLGFANGQLTLDRGEPVAADFVVAGTGVKPRTALAEAAGLKVDNGVVVDDRLRTSAQDVYAAGDIARYPGGPDGGLIRVEHWVHAERQGQHIARMILGEEAPFTDPPFFWSAHYDRSLRYSGHAETFDAPEVEGSLPKGDAIARYRQDGKLLAVATLDRDLANLQAEHAFEQARQAKS